MSTTDINIINVNGLDYPIKDQKARDIAESAVKIFAYYEDGLVASQAYATIGTPICWKGDLYYTIATVAKGEIWEVGVNLRVGEKAGLVLARVNGIEDELTANGNRIYMDYQNGKYGYNTDSQRGADTFVPFKSVEPGTTVCVGSINGANSGKPVKIPQGGTYSIYAQIRRYGGYDPYVTVVVNGVTKWSWHNPEGEPNVAVTSGTIVLQEDDMVYCTSPSPNNIGMANAAIICYKTIT